MSSKPYPKPEELSLQSTECRIPPEFVPHPDEPNLTFNPRVAEYRFLTIKPSDKNKEKKLRNYDFISYEGRDTRINDEKDVQNILDVILRKKGTLRAIFDVLPIRKSDEDVIQQFQLGTSLTPSKTPYDINVTEQCYVILLLDPRINWRFTTGGRGVTTKAFHGTDNFGVRFATREKPDSDESSVAYSNPSNHFGAPADCHVLYFAVARRRHDAVPPQEGYSSKQSFNFHMEFVWPEALTVPGLPEESQADAIITLGDEVKIWKYLPERTMPTVFDPDVPNSGGASFP